MTYPYGVVTTWVHRVKSGTDSFGNDVFTTTEVDVKAQAFDPGTSLEQVQGQDVVVTQPTVYYPTGTVPVAVDAIRIGGLTYEVDADPKVPASPLTGWQPGVVVPLRRVTG